MQILPLKLWQPEHRMEFIKKRVAVHEEARIAAERGIEFVTPCTDEERWKNEKKGEYVRCGKYCAVNKFCFRYQQDRGIVA